MNKTTEKIYQQSFVRFIIVQNFSIAKFIFTFILMIIFILWEKENNNFIRIIFLTVLILLITNLIIKLLDRKKLKYILPQIIDTQEKLFIIYSYNKQFNNIVIKKEQLIYLLERNFNFCCEKIEIYNKKNPKHKKLTLLTPTII